MKYKIKSTNPNLLSILNKNPSSNFGMYLEKLGEGVLVGNCISEYEYRVGFHIGQKNSFPKNESNQLDFQDFCNPRIFLSSINSLFETLIKDKTSVLQKRLGWLDNKTIQEIDSKEFLTTISIDNIYIDSNWAKRNGEFVLAKYFPQIKNFRHIIGNIYSFDIESNSIVECINMLSFVAMMLSVVNFQYYRVEKDVIKKYLRILKNIGNIPYFVIYLFKVRVLNDPQVFEVFKNELEQISQEPLKLSYGNTHTQRINAILPLISYERNVVDFGSGELIYAKKILPKLGEGLKYFAIDVDEDVADHVSKIKDRFKNPLIYHKEIPSSDVLNQDFEVIMSEVLEHVGIEEGKKIILQFLNNPFCKKIIVTTPNKDFNVHYKMEENEVRRYDHVQELTEKEFVKFVGSIDCLTDGKIYLKSLFIGDDYKDITPTQGFLIEKI